MPFIGNQPAEKYTSFAQQSFTIVNSQTNYTLDHSVANGKEILLYVNNVKQEEGSSNAYTASGTTLTLSSALTNGTDTMYCLFIGKAIQTVNPPEGSVDTAQLVDSSVTSAKIASGVLPTNTPLVAVRSSTSQTISTGTDTKVQLDTEMVDTDNTFDSSTNYRWSPGVAGKYYMTGTVSINIASAGKYLQAKIFKNGSMVAHQQVIAEGTNNTYQATVDLIDDNDGNDYYELYIRQNTGSNSSLNSHAEAKYTRFFGYKLIG